MRPGAAIPGPNEWSGPRPESRPAPPVLPVLAGAGPVPRARSLKSKNLAEERARMVQEEDLGETILFIARMPPHICLNEIHITPLWNRGYIGSPDFTVTRDD